MKVFKKVLAAAISVAMMAVSVTAFATTNAEYDKTTKAVSLTPVAADGVATTGQLTVVVVPTTFGDEGGVAATAPNIYYINQDDADSFQTILNSMGVKEGFDTDTTSYEVRIGGDQMTDFVTFNVTVKGGQVTIIYGDADDNGVVEVADATRIIRYKAGWSGIEVGAGADADGNNVVEVADATRIIRYKAGWSVTLGPAA